MNINVWTKWIISPLNIEPLSCYFAPIMIELNCVDEESVCTKVKIMQIELCEQAPKLCRIVCTRSIAQLHRARACLVISNISANQSDGKVSLRRGASFLANSLCALITQAEGGGIEGRHLQERFKWNQLSYEKTPPFRLVYLSENIPTLSFSVPLFFLATISVYLSFLSFSLSFSCLSFSFCYCLLPLVCFYLSLSLSSPFCLSLVVFFCRFVIFSLPRYRDSHLKWCHCPC